MNLSSPFQLSSKSKLPRISLWEVKTTFPILLFSLTDSLLSLSLSQKKVRNTHFMKARHRGNIMGLCVLASCYVTPSFSCKKLPWGSCESGEGDLGKWNKLTELMISTCRGCLSWFRWMRCFSHLTLLQFYYYYFLEFYSALIYTETL